MKTLDEWAADQCNCVLYTAKEINEHGQYWYDDWGNDFDYEWKLSDSRCREIVREHLRLDTIAINDWDINMESMWLCYERHKYFNARQEGKGKTIKEAEINCIQAIREAYDQV